MLTSILHDQNLADYSVVTTITHCALILDAVVVKVICGYCTVADPGGFEGFDRTPLSAQVTSVSLYVLWEILDLIEPLLTNSKKLLTVAHLGVFLSDFWSTTYRQPRPNTQSAIENGRGQRKSRRGFKNLRAQARVLWRILDPPLLYVLFLKYSHYFKYCKIAFQCLSLQLHHTGLRFSAWSIHGLKNSFFQICTGRLLGILCQHYQRVNVLRFSDDGTYLLSGGDDSRVLVWKFGRLYVFDMWNYIP